MRRSACAWRASTTIWTTWAVIRTHHTFFEMLGNWSFGDYYKKEAITWAWQLLTDVWGLDKSRLWATCFEDEQGIVPRDDEAANYWRKQPGFDKSHLLFFGRKENFWEMAEIGPCGPDSEIHYDRGPEYCNKQDVPGHVCSVNGDCPRFLEIWNLVFIQYNRTAPTELHPLPARHVDTGMGFERVVSILQGVDSNYKTDLFLPLIHKTQKLTGHTDAEVEENLVAYRVIADHARAAAFLIADGALPGNVGRNYVLRMILRRAARFGRMLGFDGPFMAEIADVVIENMGDHYRELRDRREHILYTITDEERRFHRTLDLGLGKLEEVLAANQDSKIVPGAEAFKLYDTFGLSVEITKDIALERGYTVDMEGFQKAMAEQREKASAATKFEGAGDSIALYQQLKQSLIEQGVIDESGVEFDPYTAPEMETKVIGLIVNGKIADHADYGDKVEVVLAGTPFYVESGGQVSDVGVIAKYSEQGGEPIWGVDVTDMRRPLPGLIVHVGEVSVGEPRSQRRLLGAGRLRSAAGHHAQSHGHALAARAIAERAGAARAAGRIARRARSVPLRLHARLDADAGRDRSDQRERQQSHSGQLSGDGAAQELQGRRGRRRDGAVRRKVRRCGARHPHGLARREAGEHGTVRRHARHADGRDRFAGDHVGGQRGRGPAPHRRR